MKRVTILPEEITSKIAAGEVIERPASAVKELLENSVDAQADTIEIHLQEAGKKKIEITDSGLGIHPEDIKKIFNRHATSKISNTADLNNITSFGFRGEALYSIGSVSDIVLRSRISSADSGWEIRLRGSKRLSFKPVSMNPGTHIEINELFYNTPGRKKFLKSNNQELYHILKTVNPYVLALNNIRFKVVHQGRNILDLPKQPSLKNRIAQTLNLDPGCIIEQEKNFSRNNISLKLFLGDINIQRARKDLQFIFINNRPVNYYRLGFHINQAYESLFPRGIYPFFAVFINILPETVDVNIHPAKREVKIKDEHTLSCLLRTLIPEALSSQGRAKQIDQRHPFLKSNSFFQDKEQSPYQSQYTQQLQEKQACFSPAGNFKASESQQNNQPGLTSQNLTRQLSVARYIGCFFKKYLFFETESDLLIIDQHAAHERITYERFLKEIESGHIETQHLLQPLVITVSAKEMLIWERINPLLEKAGFSTRLWDKNHIALHTRPTLINDPEIALLNLISSEQKPDYFDKKTIASKACRQSLKTGYSLSSQEALTLRKELLKSANPFTCPHGRPLIIQIPEAVFEKQFLRR
jgi:DNA mismatch repair protein MutL